MLSRELRNFGKLRYVYECDVNECLAGKYMFYHQIAAQNLFSSVISPEHQGF
jgi:hypothetical protein